ncbi:hypothetical protein ABPG72_017717 [Tetrahymena utriculariae]
MNNSTPVDYKDNYSIQSFPNSQSDKSKPSYDKPNSQNKIEGVWSFNNQNFIQVINSQITHENIQSSGQQSIKSNHDKIEINSNYPLQNQQLQQLNAIQSQWLFNNQNLSQGVNSQITHENDQFSVQQSKKSNQDKSQTSCDKLNNQVKVTKIGNIESLNNLQQQQQINSLQFLQQFTNQHIINQGISSQSQISHQNECDFPISEINEVEIRSINPEEKSQQIYQSFQLIIQNHKQFQLNKDQIEEKLRKKSYELDCCIQTGEENLIKIIFNLTQGLIDLYNQSILHLDIKPQNILFDDKGNYIYCDFGISVIYQEGETFFKMAFTQKYASPEQEKHQISKIGFTSDTYSLGKTLIKVLKKFKEDNPNSQILRFVDSLKNIIVNQMIQDEIKKRSDCYSIHSQFSDELLKIKDMFADLEFFREIENDINHYLRQQSLTMIVNNQINLKTIEIIEEDWPSDVKIFYFEYNQVGLQETGLEKLQKFSNLTSELDRKYGIGLVQAEGIVACLEQFQNLTNFDIDLSNDLEGAQGIGLGLKNLQNLTNLVLDKNKNSIFPERAEGIVASLQKLQNLTNLTLNINKNFMSSEQAKGIAAGLQTLQNLTNLTLNVSKNFMSSEQAKGIAAGLQTLQNLTNLTLNVSSNNIGLEKTKGIVEGLKKLKNLTNLTLFLTDNDLYREQKKEIRKTLEKLKNLTDLTLHLDFI